VDVLLVGVRSSQVGLGSSGS